MVSKRIRGVLYKFGAMQSSDIGARYAQLWDERVSVRSCVTLVRWCLGTGIRWLLSGYTLVCLCHAELNRTCKAP